MEDITMRVNVERTLDRIIEESKKLNALSDKASQLIRETEARLEGVGVNASYITVSEGCDDPLILSYERLHGKYRICLQEGSIAARPFTESTRDAKLRAINHLHDLLLTIEKAVVERTLRLIQFHMIRKDEGHGAQEDTR